MNDVYIIESWFGERLNVRNVYAADAAMRFKPMCCITPVNTSLACSAGMGLASDEAARPVRRRPAVLGHPGLSCF
jgi:hypothetical protein